MCAPLRLHLTLCPLSVYLCALQGTLPACSLDLSASPRVARTQRLFSSFSITIFSHLLFSHLRSSLVIFHHILIFFSTNHTPHSHGWQTVSTNTTSCGRICFLVFKRRSRPDSGLQRSFIDSRECEHSISFFQGFALWVFQQVVKEKNRLK